MEHELLEGREIRLIALEDTPSRTQKCFVAFDNNVMVSMYKQWVYLLLAILSKGKLGKVAAEERQNCKVEVHRDMALHSSIRVCAS